MGLVNTPESFEALKILDVYLYVLSGHVHEVFYHPVSEDCPFYF